MDRMILLIKKKIKPLMINQQKKNSKKELKLVKLKTSLERFISLNQMKIKVTKINQIKRN